MQQHQVEQSGERACSAEAVRGRQVRGPKRGRVGQGPLDGGIARRRLRRMGAGVVCGIHGHDGQHLRPPGVFFRRDADEHVQPERPGQLLGDKLLDRASFDAAEQRGGKDADAEGMIARRASRLPDRRLGRQPRGGRLAGEQVLDQRWVREAADAALVGQQLADGHVFLARGPERRPVAAHLVFVGGEPAVHQHGEADSVDRLGG